MTNDNKTKPFIIVIIILSVVILGLGGYIIYKNLNENKINDNEKNDSEKEISLTLGKSILEKTVAYSYCNQMSDFYIENKITNNSILMLSLKDYLTTNNIDINNFDNDGEFTLNISKTKMDESVKKVFGNISYSATNFSYSLAQITYKNNNYSLVNSPGGCEELTNTIKTKLNKAYQIGNNIYLEENVLFGKVKYNEENNNYYYDYHNNINYSNLIVSQNINETISDSNYLKGAVYKYTFEVDNNNYIFKSIEKIK